MLDPLVAQRRSSEPQELHIISCRCLCGVDDLFCRTIVSDLVPSVSEFQMSDLDSRKSWRAGERVGARTRVSSELRCGLKARFVIRCCFIASVKNRKELGENKMAIYPKI